MSNYFESNYDRGTSTLTSARVFSSVMTRVYAWMCAALCLTAGTAIFTASSPALLSLVFGSGIGIWVLILAELGLVVALSAGINRLSTSTATMLFLLYSIVNGVTLASIFFAYELGTIYQAFAASALTFGGMSLVGATTKRDLSGLGGILVMGLIGLIIASVVNMFWANGTMDAIITYVGVFLFVGLTAYDTQKIKQMCAAAPEGLVGKVSILGALSLYLDFINLFLYILRLLGRNRD